MLELRKMVVSKFKFKAYWAYRHSVSLAQAHINEKSNKSSHTYRIYIMHIYRMNSKIAKWLTYIVQSTLVISNSKGLSEILRDIRSSTYQVCRIEKKIIWLTTFNKLIGNWTFEVRDILKILWKRGEIAPLEQFLLFSTIFSICC